MARHCTACKTTLTPDNTYVRKSGIGKGGLFHLCKGCSSDDVLKRKWKNKTNKEIKAAIAKYENIVLILKTALGLKLISKQNNE